MELPDIDAVSFGELPSVAPGDAAPVTVSSEGGRRRVASAVLRTFDSSFFDLLDRPVLIDRSRPGSERDVLISRRLAVDMARTLDVSMQYLPGRTLSHPDLPQIEAGSEPFRIAGIAPDLSGLDDDPGAVYLEATSLGASGGRFIMLRARSGTLGNPRDVHRALARVHPAVTAGKIRPLSSAVWSFRGALLNGRLIFGVFGAASLIFSALGLWGLWELDLRRRRRQLGVRQALGATPARIFREMLAPGLRLTALGSGVGVPAAWALLKILSAIHDLPEGTASTLATATGAVIGLAVLVGLLPSLRASRVAPSAALREE